MGEISIHLPDGMHNRLTDLALREGVSIDHFVAAAVADRVCALMGDDAIPERARRGSRAKYEAALAEVPDMEPDEHDRF